MKGLVVQSDDSWDHALFCDMPLRAASDFDSTLSMCHSRTISAASRPDVLSRTASSVVVGGGVPATI